MDLICSLESRNRKEESREKEGASERLQRAGKGRRDRGTILTIRQTDVVLEYRVPLLELNLDVDIEKR